MFILALQCPMFKQDDSGKQVPELFAEEAKYFTEVRLLQRDVQIILEGVSNQNLLGTVLHPVCVQTMNEIYKQIKELKKECRPAITNIFKSFNSIINSKP